MVTINTEPQHQPQQKPVSRYIYETDKPLLLEFFDRLGLEPYLEVIPRKGAPITVDLKHPDADKVIQEHIDAGANCYYRCHVHGNRKRKDHYERTRILLCDIDTGNDEEIEFAIKPNLVIDTSIDQKNGKLKRHYLWSVSTKNIDEWKRVENHLTNHYGHDRSASLITQISRAPFLPHTKPIKDENKKIIGYTDPFNWLCPDLPTNELQ